MLESPTGARMLLRHWLPASAPTALILVLHGLAEHAGRYGPFAEFLAGHDFAVYAPDHRGHGGTTAPGAPLGRFAWRDGVRLVIEDVMAVRAHAVREFPEIPVFLFGHSMGAMIAMATAQTYPEAFGGLAAWNADLDPGLAGKAGRLLLKIERALKGSDVPSTYGPRFTFERWAKSLPDAKTDFDWLSRDGNEVDAYVSDPLCGWDPSVSLWLDLLALAERAGSTTSLARLSHTLPIHLVGGGQDPATSNGRAVEWLHRKLGHMGFLNASLNIYPEMRHETLNEFGREKAMRDFAIWANAVARNETGIL